MVSKLFLSLTLFGIYVTATKPPDLGNKSNITSDKKPENYLYGYSIYGKDNAVQKRIEFREGEKTQGNIVVQLPKGESVSNVQYTADEEGFHPVVRISTKNNHSEVTSHFALGDVAVNKLHSDINGTSDGETRDTISMVLSTLFPNGVEEFMQQQRQQQDNTTSDLLTPSHMSGSIQSEIADNLMEFNKLEKEQSPIKDFYSQNRLETPFRRRGRLLQENITNLIESTRNLITNEDVLQINDAAEFLLAEDYQNLQSNPNITQSMTAENSYQFDDNSDEDNGFNIPIIVEDNMISSSQDIDRMYVLPPPLLPLLPSQIEILPSRENFVNQIRPEIEQQRNVQIVKQNEGKLSMKTKELGGYEVKEKLVNDIGPVTERYKPLFSTASPKLVSTVMTPKGKIFVTPSRITPTRQLEMSSANDRSVSSIFSSTTPIPHQNRNEKTIVEVQKSINIHNMMIKQDGNYFEQHEEYINPSGYGLLRNIGSEQYLSPSSVPTTVFQYSKATTPTPSVSSPKFYVTEKSKIYPEIIKSESFYKPNINPKTKSGKNLISFYPKQATIKYLGQIPYISAETMLTPVVSSYQIMSKDPGKTLIPNNANSYQQIPSEQGKYYMAMANLKPNNPQTLFLMQKPQKLIHIEKRPLSTVLQLNRQNVGYYANNIPSSLPNNNANPSRNQYHTAKESLPIEIPHYNHHQTTHPYAFMYPLYSHQHYNSFPGSSSSISNSRNNDQIVQSKILLPKGINKQIFVTEKTTQLQQSYPIKQKPNEKFIEKPIQMTTSPLLAAGTVTAPKTSSTATTAAVSTVQVPLRIPIQVPIYNPAQFPLPGIHVPVAIAPVSTIPHLISPASSIFNDIIDGHRQSSNSLSLDTKQKQQQLHQQQQNQYQHLQQPISSSATASIIGPGHQIQYNGHNSDNSFDNSVPVNYQLSFLGQDILHPLFYNSRHHHILNGNRNRNSLDTTNGQFYTHIPSIPPNLNLNQYMSANKYANNFNYNKNYFGKDFNESIKKPLSINDNSSSNINSNTNSNSNSNAKVSNLIKRDEYIGPVPLKTEKSHWNSVAQSNNNSMDRNNSNNSSSSDGSSSIGNIINSRRTIQHKRSYDFEKNLKMEYGFKPPMVPSIEIDEQGMPINHKDD